MQLRKLNAMGRLARKLQRLLGTDAIAKQNQILKHQTAVLEAVVASLKEARQGQAQLQKQLERHYKDASRYAARSVDTQIKSYGITKDLRERLRNQSKSLEQVIVSLFEANRTLFNFYRGDEFDIGRSGASFFSQNGEDGIILEIARRLDLTIESFLEIGAGDGRENNSIHLLLGGASGVWIEADEDSIRHIETLHESALRVGRLKVVKARVTAETVDQVLRDAAVPRQVDFLSLDIDGNDYWVWRALSAVSAGILCLEYNAAYGPSISWVKNYDPEFIWPGKNIYYGASLKALEKLSLEKGYTLVACDYSGVNAFFVRTDLLNDRFTGPFTSEHLFQPFRGSIGRWPPTKEIVFGPCEKV